MSFEDSLQRQQPPSRVGEVRLSFEGSFFLGQAERPGGNPLPEALSLGALACALFAFIGLLRGAPAGSATLLAAVAGALSLASLLTRRRLRARRAFSLNYATESLRVDFVDGWLARPRTEIVPFDAVEAVEVVSAAPWFRLEVVYRTERGEVRRPLVERARPDEVEALRRLWRVVRNGVGLKPAGGEG